jgi:hypothetical protein
VRREYTARLLLSATCSTCLLSGCYALWGVHVDRNPDSNLPVHAITLRKGYEYHSGPFVINKPVEYGYGVGLGFERKLPFERLDCLTGTSEFWKASRCKDGTESVVDVSWRIESEGRMIASGRYTGSPIGAGYGANIYKDVGTFKPQPGVSYTLHLQVNRDAPQLDITNPYAYVARPSLK